MQCIRCGYELDPLESKCPRCARAGPPVDVACPICRALNDPRAHVCQVCGSALGVAPSQGWDQHALAAPESRLAAHAIDLVLLILGCSLLLALIWAVCFLIGRDRYVSSMSPDRLVDWRLLIALGIAYHAALVGRLGWTLGKRALGLRVVGRDGLPPGLWRGLLRAAAQMASIATLGLAFLWIAWDRDRRGLHDLLADTAVVRRRR